MIIKGTIIEFKKKTLKKIQTERVHVLINQTNKASIILDIPFSYTSFPAIIFYNKTILIGHKLNVDYEGNPDLPDQIKAQLLPWERQDIHLREEIYKLFLESMSELYFTKEKNNQFKKEFDKYKRQRLKGHNRYQLIRSMQLQDKQLQDELISFSLEKRELRKNRERLERIFRLDIDDS